MLQKIKDLMKIKEEIDIINRKVEENCKAVDSLKDHISPFKEILENLTETQKELLTNLKDNISVIHHSKEDLKKEVFDFKLLKNEIQKNIMKKFEEELEKKLFTITDTLKSDMENYNKLRENISTTSSRTENLSKEIEKFTQISKNIKKEDFELTKFANKLIEADKEKLELMKKIDTLERLISKMRRNHVHRP